MTSTPANLASTSAAASDDIAARVVAFVSEELYEPVEPLDIISDRCDDRRESIVLLLNRFEDTFGVDMSAYDYDTEFPSEPISLAAAILGIFVGPMVIAMPAFALFNQLMPKALALLLAFPIWFIGVIICAKISEWMFPHTRPKHFVTVQTLIDAARAKRWTPRAMRVTTP
jgi:hypothetical protein